LKSDRNKEIVRLIDEQKVTKTAIGKWFKISKQRVQQIYQEEKARNVQDIRTSGDGKDNNAS
jgi:DNA-directed RNA polymerase specialized sigma subunit